MSRENGTLALRRSSRKRKLPRGPWLRRSNWHRVDPATGDVAAVHFVFNPLTFIERLAALGPAPGMHLVTYHGALASELIGVVSSSTR